MATTGYGKTYYPGTGLLPDVPAEMGKMATSLEGRTVMDFPSIAAKDAAFAQLTDDQKKGVIVHVAGKGWQGYDNGTWRQFPMQDVTYIVGVANIVTDGGGIFGINHPFGTGVVFPFLTHQLAGPYDAATYLESRLRYSLIATEPTQVVFRCWNIQTFQVYSNAAMVFQYLIIRAA